MIDKNQIEMHPLNEFLTEYKELNKDNKYRPVAVGRYGIRTRESIYSKELASDYSKNKLIYKNTLTVGMGSVQMDIGILTDDVTYSVSPAYHTYKIDGIDCDYLRYCLQQRNMDMFTQYMKRGSRQGKSIDLGRWITYKIPVYPESVQYEIIDRLRKVQLIIESRQQELQKLDELVKARFVEMFGSITDNKYGFEIMTIQDVCEPIKDGTHQTPTYTEDSENGFKFLSSKDVTSGKVDWNHLKYIPKELHEELYKRIAPRKGDILLAKNGTTGIGAIVDRDEIFDIYVSLALLRPICVVNSEYLCAAVNAQETKKQFDDSLKGIGVPNLHLGEIKKTKIIVPPMELQNQFADFVKQVDKSKAEVQKALDEAQLLLDSLMQKYFG